MAKKKKITLLSKEQQKVLETMAIDLTDIAANMIREYEDLDLSDLGLSELSGSLNQITQVHEDSPFLDELLKGDSWKTIVKNIPTIPETPGWTTASEKTKKTKKKDKKDDSK
jgi:hypothetical protein